MTINSQRRKAVNFSMPYYATGQALMIRKGDVIKSFADLEDKAIGEETGVNEYITKPFELDTIVKKVEEYLK